MSALDTYFKDLRVYWQWWIQDFPLGGRQPVGGGANLRCIQFSAKMYAKTKEIDPVGGRAPRRPPGSANDWSMFTLCEQNKKGGNLSWSQIVFDNLFPAENAAAAIKPNQASYMLERSLIFT